MTHPPQSGSAADTQKGNLQNTVTESSQGAAPVGRRSKPLRIGSLFAGYGGAELAVQSVFRDATPAWFVEYDKHPSTILAAHWPDVPNYGDVTTVDWAAVEPVDILTGGYPCQPFSHAGKREGENDERHLFPYVADAISHLRPRLVCLENVYGHLSLGGPAVIGTLTGLGYSVRWGVVRASDAGAPHRRARLFIVAHDRDAPSGAGRGRREAVPGVPREQRADGAGVDRTTADTAGERSDRGGASRSGRWREPANGGVAAADASGQRHGPGQDTGGLGRLDGPDADGTRQRQRAREELGDRSAAAHADTDQHRPQVIEREQPGLGARDDADGRRPQFGPYAAAVHRWEHVTGRNAPAPTEPGRDGRPRLNPKFVEFMMGLPDGWVTDTGIPRAAQLKALGNGIVPQQMALALRLLLADEAVAA